MKKNIKREKLNYPRSLIYLSKDESTLSQWTDRTEKNYVAWYNYAEGLFLKKNKETKRKYQKFEFLLSFQSIKVSPADYEYIKKCLHPQDYKRVLPTPDNTIPEGYYWIDEKEMYVFYPRIGPDIDYDLLMSEEDRWDLVYQTPN